MGGTHLSQHLVQPLQGSIQVNLNPARRAGHILTVVLRTPALYKTHAYRTHLGQLIHSLEPMVDRMTEQGSKLLVVEDLEGAAWWDLAHGGGVKAVVVVAVATLDEDAVVAQALRIYFPTNIIQMYT